MPDTVKNKIGEFVKLIPGLEPHPSDNFHVTIKFIGEIDDQQLEAARNAIADAAVEIPQFSVGFKGLKFEESRLRFLVKNPEPLMALRSSIEHGLQAIHIVREDPLRYEPHITLGKIKMAPQREPVFDYESLNFNVDRIVLFETIRGEKTARFVPLQEFMLW